MAIDDNIQQLAQNWRAGPFAYMQANTDPSETAYDTQAVPLGSVPTGFIDTGAVDTAQIAAGAITATEITDGSITTPKLAANAVTAAKITAGTITTTEIAAGTITASNIAANTITSSEIHANAITSSELASSSVQSQHFTAACIDTTSYLAGSVVTSAKIGSTLSGKLYSASTSNPGYYFDSSSSQGMGISGSDTYVTGNANALYLTGSPLYTGTPRPNNGAGGQDIGTSSTWYGTINYASLSSHSDQRSKMDIVPSPLGLDFLRNLRPVAYRWKETRDTQALESARLDRDALHAEVAPLEAQIEALSGDERDVELPKLQAQIAAIEERHLAPVRAVDGKMRPGKRLHYGLLAQEVKAALDKAGVDTGTDGGFWFEDAESGIQSLDYTQLIAPLIAAVQELAQRVEALEEGT